MELKEVKNELLLPPDPESLTQALRGVGYSLETAIADIIDNSISAGAKNISVKMSRATGGSEAGIVVVDDGRGMNREELIQAMKLGSISPLRPRDRSDLGRFGLGLKTASFSQCRRLTVFSRQNGEDSSFAWDLDDVASKGEWILEERTPVAPIVGIEGNHGTAVVWGKIDRVHAMDSNSSDQEWNALRQRVATHLGLIFHRFLTNESIRIDLDGRAILAMDPFACGADAGKPCDFPVETWPETGAIKATLQCFVLPLKPAGGKTRYLKGEEDDLGLQGFFIYRGNRLLQAGGWLGFKGFRVADDYKLARIRLDFENDGDAEWRVDIKKSKATPPAEMRDWLRKRALVARTRSEQTVRRHAAHEGRRTQEKQLWVKERASPAFPDWSSPVIEAVFSRFQKGELTQDELRGFLELLSISHPSAAIGQYPSTEETRKTASVIFEELLNDYSRREAEDIMRTSVPFCNWPDFLDELCGDQNE